MVKKNYFFIFSLIIAELLFLSCSGKNSSLYAAGEALIPLNEEAENNTVDSPDDSPYLFYRFTDGQKSLIKEMQCYEDGVSLRINVSPKEKMGKFSFGFLYKNDFLSEEKILTPLTSRYQVRGNYSDVKNKNFGLKFCIKKSDEPEGFYYYSTAKAEILECELENYAIGIDFARSLFAFGTEGGSLSSKVAAIDFSRAGTTFSSDKMLVLKINKKKAEKATSTERIVFENRNESFSVRLAGSKEIKFHEKGFKNGLSKVTIKSGLEYVDSLMLYNAGSQKAISADIGMILGWPEESWRRSDFELFRWDAFPGVLFFDFATYRIQDSFLTRLAYFVEKTGYKGTFVDDDFILNNHGYNAHDYKAYDIARFFTKAKKIGFVLNENEELLKSILIENGIITVLPDGTYEEGTGCIISISRESSPYLRNQLVAHECWHGIYFMNEGFRDYVKELYNTFNPEAMNFLKSYWATAPGLGYDLNDEYLMKNEFMAYHLQLGPDVTGKYFLTRSYWSNMREFPDLVRYVQHTEGKAYEDIAYKLSDYVYEHWGLYGGRTFLVFREEIQ
ncbi:hypothetical protein [Treponema sp.]|uniref:hypothetical protein n=1 Tax=Treponema sp. TaxID=166 RepID=UPI0025E16A66|nr:hypothetical protein [Treponema sp.]MCR5219256.1 hypothetical protein [Treponema sp.]